MPFNNLNKYFILQNMNDSHLRLETIFEHFPQEWRGFLGALSVSCDQLVSAEAWLSSHLYNRTAHPVAWETLLQTLSEEEPVSSKEGLILYVSLVLVV